MKRICWLSNLSMRTVSWYHNFLCVSSHQQWSFTLSLQRICNEFIKYALIFKPTHWKYRCCFHKAVITSLSYLTENSLIPIAPLIFHISSQIYCSITYYPSFMSFQYGITPNNNDNNDSLMIDRVAPSVQDRSATLSFFF